MSKRDRHGRLRDGEIRTAQDIWDMLRAPQYAEIDRIAGIVRGDRNGGAYPERIRATIKARVRPHFRDALEYAKAARAALRAKDMHAFEVGCLRAWVELLSADVHFRQAYIDDHVGKQRDRARRPRTRIKADTSTSLADLVRTLDYSQRDGHGDTLPAADLWPHLFALLDELGLEPGEDPARKAIAFDGSTVTYDTFSRTLRRHRGSRPRT